MEHSSSPRHRNDGGLRPLRPPSAQASAAVRHTLSAGLEHYDRQRHLPRLIPIMPSQLADCSIAGRRAIVARLARALRAERMRGRAGHWTYDLNRHIGLHQAYVAERARLPLAERPK